MYTMFEIIPRERQVNASPDHPWCASSAAQILPVHQIKLINPVDNDHGVNILHKSLMIIGRM